MTQNRTDTARSSPNDSTSCAGPGRQIVRSASALRRAESGSVAVEFAIVIIPFLVMVGAALDIALGFFAQANLEQAVADASRAIYTGTFQTNNSSEKDPQRLLTNFRTLVCQDNGKPRVTLFDCQNVRVDIAAQSDFSSVTPKSPTTTDPGTGTRSWNPAFGTGYTCARGSAVALVQVAVDFPVFFSLLNPASVSLSTNRRLLQAASVFRVEPYGSGACS